VAAAAIPVASHVVAPAWRAIKGALGKRRVS
jgi:hypothetical protein